MKASCFANAGAFDARAAQRGNCLGEKLFPALLPRHVYNNFSQRTAMDGRHEVLLAAMARKVASLEISGPVKRRYNNTLRGLASLPLTIRPAGA